MDDSYTELKEIFTKKIEDLENKTHEELLTLCGQENLEIEGLEDKQIKEALIEYYKEEIED